MKTRSMFKVDKGIPIPPAKKLFGDRRGHRAAIYPWSQMEVGDSFFVEGVGHSSLMNCSRRHGKFVTRKIKENGVVGVRVWRVE